MMKEPANKKARSLRTLFVGDLQRWADPTLTRLAAMLCAALRSLSTIALQKIAFALSF
jgi:hypothetical protein